MRNTLFYGDNLPILREHIADASVDLIYLDPPFNSNRSYNVLFKQESGRESQAQVKAFDDTWHWVNAAETYHHLITHGPAAVTDLLSSLYTFLGDSQMMAYLAMMTARLVELHRVLKPTGSLYLHCDPTASHYLKVVLDTIFGARNFKTELIWKRSSAHSDTKQGRMQHGRVHDVILFHTKSQTWTWNPQYLPYTKDYLGTEYRHTSEAGRNFKETDLTAAKPGGDTEYDWHVRRPKGGKERWQADLEEEYRNPQLGWEYRSVRPYQGRYWAYSKSNLVQFYKEGRLIHRKTGMPRLVQYSDEMSGVSLQDVWTDIPPALGKEALGYPTQKPVALLERIIAASSNPGDIVLDPFCGCGTTIVAAQKLGRQWLGIDITNLSIALLKYRLNGSFGLDAGQDFVVVGEPADLEGAYQLAEDDRYQFQWWAISLIQAQPLGGEAGSKQGKKGADKGIDGIMVFIDDASKKPKRVIVQVKSGKVNSATIRDLRGVVEREKAAIGVLITLEPATPPMRKEAVAAGYYHSPGFNKDYPRLQILTIEELLNGAKVNMPMGDVTFKEAEKIEQISDAQLKLL